MSPLENCFWSLPTLNSNSRNLNFEKFRTKKFPKLSNSHHHQDLMKRHIKSLSTNQLISVITLFLIGILAFMQNIQLINGLECKLNIDCNNPDKICHENKCICVRDKPVQDNNRCLKLLLIGESCSISEQCLGNSQCTEGVCSCGDGISIYNPSTKIFYCHPRKNLKEDCTHDLQCPANSYCSLDRFGCLCQNGFAPTFNLKECLPKTCTNTTDCETELHHCYEQKCMCLPGHFDLVRAECYRYGSTGGTYSIDDDDSTANKSQIPIWLIILLLIVISLIILIALFGTIFKRHYKYCWWTQTKEYEPNNKTAANKISTAFQSNTINKSFRRKKDVEANEFSPASNNNDDDTTTTSTNHIDSRIKSPLMPTSTPV